MSVSSRGRSLVFFLVVVAAVFAADQLAKLWCVRSMDAGQSVEIVGDWVRLTSVRNTGAAFGLLPGNARRLVVASVLALGVVAYAYFALPPGRRRERIALALIGGGAVGNLADRIRLGEVIDFVDVGIGEQHRWPTFNVADSAVSVGVVLLLLFAYLRRREERRHAEPAARMVEPSESA